MMSTQIVLCKIICVANELPCLKRALKILGKEGISFISKKRRFNFPRGGLEN